MKEITIRFTSLEKDEAEILISVLKRLGYEFIPLEVSIVRERVILLPLTIHSEKKTLMEENLWLKDQYRNSSVLHLKVMPVFLYHGKDEDAETLFEENVQDLYEEIFSGEFKPFAWNLDSEAPVAEFERVLNEYSE